MTREFGNPGPLLIVALLIVGGLAACGGPVTELAATKTSEPASAEQIAAAGKAETPATPLAGTEWHLMYFESMDDSLGHVKPEPSQAYTMRLNDDGTVDMTLNCNRANGTWTAEQGADGASGRFAFGPLAGTKALCPPPSMDERLVADASYVTGFLLRDGNLYLSLMADAGVYAWGPVKGPARSGVAIDGSSTPALDDSIRKATKD